MWCPQNFDALFVERESRTAPHLGMVGPTFERSAPACHRTLVCRRLRSTPASCLRGCGFWNTPTNAHPEICTSPTLLGVVAVYQRQTRTHLRSDLPVLPPTRWVVPRRRGEALVDPLVLLLRFGGSCASLPTHPPTNRTMENHRTSSRMAPLVLALQRSSPRPTWLLERSDGAH